MKKILLFFSVLAYTFVVYAGPVSEQQALAKASQFMPGKEFVIARTSENTNKDPNNSTPFYVFNAEGNAGFVIVSGDDRTKPILGYSENGALRENALPENVQWWLDYYAKAIAALENSSAEAGTDGATASEKSTIAPLIKTQWNQSSPYNDQCVFDGLGSCVTGCVATAMAQIVNFYKYPESVPEIDAYTAIWSRNTFEALPATTLNWMNMTNEDVAKLLRYCGQSVEMDYGPSSSSATSELVSLALIKYFGYNKSAHAIYRDGYSPEGWESEIYQELAAGYPILYSGQSTSGGHAFIVDGYKDGLYHVNWGWGGYCDTYFVLTLMDSHGPNRPDLAFSEDQSAIVGVRPSAGGTLNYPLMTSSKLEFTSDRELTRGSASENFTVSVSFRIYNSVNSEDIRCGYGLALYRGNERLGSLLQFSQGQQRPGWYSYGTYDVRFGAGLADGTYRIEGVYLDGDNTLHEAQGFGYRYIEAVVKDNKLTLTNYPLIEQENSSEDNTFCYNILSETDKTVEVIAGGKKYSGNLEIPSTIVIDNVTFTVVAIGKSAFENCRDLTSIIIPNSVTSIEEKAFYYCSSLVSVTIGTGVKSIRNNAFAFCHKLKKVIVPGISAWCSIVFGNNDSNPLYHARHLYSDENTEITNLEIPSGVNSISKYAFLNCESLSSLVIPNNVTSIDAYAFQGCKNLTTMTIKSTEISIGQYAFINCVSIVDVYCYTEAEKMEWNDRFFPSKSNVFFHVSDKSAYKSKFPNAGVNFYGLNENIYVGGVRYDIISDVDKTAKVVRDPMKYKGDIEIASSCVIGDITYSVIEISSSAFGECSDLTSITIPSSVTTIGSSAFYGCTGLTSITIPSSVTSIGSSAFSDCGGLTSIKVESGNPKYDSRNDCNAIVETSSNTIIRGCKNTVILNSVTCIGTSAFSSSDLTSISIPNSVTSIGDWVFDYCSDLTSVTIGSSVASIGIGIFNNCNSLTCIKVESGNPNFDSRNDCNAIIETSSNILIRGCKSTVIPNSVTSIDRYCFEYSGLISISIPNSVTSIGESAFNSCNNLASITIPNSVTSIGNGAFQNCLGLTSVTIMSDELSIGDYAFKYCGKLTSVTVNMKQPASIYKDVFSNRANAILYVPAGCKAAYEVADYWREFKTIVEMEEPKVVLSKTKATATVGKSGTLKATVYPTTLADKSVTWKSSDTKVATVTSAGKVTTVGVGTAIITCTSNATGLSATCTLTVGKVVLSKSEATVSVGKSGTLKATVYPTTLADKSVTWKSSDKKVATVTSAGKVTAVGVGTAIITCTSVATGAKATCTLTVGKVVLSKTKATVTVGKSGTLKAAVYPETLADKSVTWKSSDTKVATVTSAGKVKAVGIGTAVITCTSVVTGAKATCTLTVGKVVLSKTKATVTVGKSGTLKATVYPETLADKSVTWKSSDTKVATVTSAGKVKAVGIGTAVITCTSVATGLSATCTLTVTASAGTRSLDGDDDEVTGFEDMGPAVTEPYDVYDLSGRMVRHQVTSLDGLPNGIYIVKGRKVLKKD